MITNIEKTLERSFLDYSAFVIQRRAIPDVRDMMKFTARQILHAQHREKLTADKPFKKSQKSVAAATSFSYVHGDTSCYEQIIRMGRPLVQRYYFQEINGNGGTPINSQDYAAARYTEARLSALSLELFKTIDMNTIASSDWEPTYDEEGVFPKVLPSIGYYNICNGSFGSIAPTMISSVPQFNLKEVNDAICGLIRDRNCPINLLPDFSSGGTLLNPQTTAQSLAKGEGKSALVRGCIEHDSKGSYLDIRSLPYGVYTNTICTELERAIDKGDCPVTSFKDLSKRNVNIRVYGRDLQKLEQWLYKNTSTQKHFTIKLILLDGGKVPKLFGIREALLGHIDHVNVVWRRALEYQLEKLKERAHIIDGLLKAHSILDDVIARIKASTGRADAIQSLEFTFQFTQKQAEAIVDLRLHRLSGIDIQKLKDELEVNHDTQADYQETLDVRDKFDLQLIGMYEEIARKYSDKRRTKIHDGLEYESAQEGSKPKEKFCFTSMPSEYMAVPLSEAEQADDVYATCIDPDDEVIIVTTQLRGFLRLGNEFILGQQVKWNEMLRLLPDEKVLFAIEKHTLENFEYITFALPGDKTGHLHQSFIMAASKRGKRLTNTKHIVNDFLLQHNTANTPRLK